MWLDAVLAVLHFIFVFILVGVLSAELIVMRLGPSAPVLRLLSRIDALYGISAGGLLLAGGARVIWGLKDASYYLGSHAFWGKMAVFLAIGLLSIIPTVNFIKWSRALKKDEAFVPAEKAWKATRRWVTIEVHALALVIIFAVLMARGIG